MSKSQFENFPLRFLAARISAVLLFVFVTTPALATNLPIGPSPVVPASTSLTGTTILATDLLLPVAGATTFTANLTTYVLKHDSGNTAGLNALTFVYELQNHGPNALHRMTVNHYTGFTTNVFYTHSLNGTPLAGTDITPTQATRNTADVVGFNFTGAPIGKGTIKANQNSEYLVVRTNATHYTSTLASVIDSSTGSVATFAPSVPEPATWVLAIFALGGLLWFAPRARGRAAVVS